MGKSWKKLEKWLKVAKSGEKLDKKWGKVANFFHKMAGGGHFG